MAKNRISDRCNAPVQSRKLVKRRIAGKPLARLNGDPARGDMGRLRFNGTAPSPQFLDQYGRLEFQDPGWATC